MRWAPAYQRNQTAKINPNAAESSDYGSHPHKEAVFREELTADKLSFIRGASLYVVINIPACAQKMEIYTSDFDGTYRSAKVVHSAIHSAENSLHSAKAFILGLSKVNHHSTRVDALSETYLWKASASLQTVNYISDPVNFIVVTKSISGVWRTCSEICIEIKMLYRIRVYIIQHIIPSYTWHKEVIYW